MRSLSVTYSASHEVGGHSHNWGQLIFAATGAIDVVTGQEAWLIPPTRAIFIPPGIRHRLRVRGASALRTLYIPAASCHTLSDKSTGLAVTGLLRELIFKTCQIGILKSQVPRHALIAGLVRDEIQSAEILPFALTMPVDRRALRSAKAIWAEPDFKWTIASLAQAAGSSGRTLQRLFLAETGLHLSQWLQLARLLAACNALLEGASVTEAALTAGFASTSAFIARFKKHTEMTPLQYKHLRQSGAQLGQTGAAPRR